MFVKLSATGKLNLAIEDWLLENYVITPAEALSFIDLGFNVSDSMQEDFLYNLQGVLDTTDVTITLKSGFVLSIKNQINNKTTLQKNKAQNLVSPVEDMSSVLQEIMALKAIVNGNKDKLEILLAVQDTTEGAF
jgi:hypothetical protein